jgi:hypothetical protein
MSRLDIYQYFKVFEGYVSRIFQSVVTRASLKGYRIFPTFSPFWMMQFLQGSDIP